MAELNQVLLPIMFGWKMFPGKTRLWLCGDANGKQGGEFQKCDFALQSLAVGLPSLRPGECAEV